MRSFMITYDVLYEEDLLYNIRNPNSDFCRELHNKYVGEKIFKVFFTERLIKDHYPRIRNTCYNNITSNHSDKVESLFLSLSKRLNIKAYFHVLNREDRDFLYEIACVYRDTYSMDCNVEKKEVCYTQSIFSDVSYLIEVSGKHMVYVLDMILLADRCASRIDTHSDILQQIYDLLPDNTIIEYEFDMRKFNIYRNILKRFFIDKDIGNRYLDNPILMYFLYPKGIFSYIIKYYQEPEILVQLHEIDRSMLNAS